MNQLRRMLYIGVLCSAVLMMTGCAKKDTLTASWFDKSFNGPIEGKVLVLGVFKNPTTHKIYEDSFVASLAQVGVDAVPSHNYAQTVKRHSKGWLENVVQESGASFVLLSHFMGEKEETSNFKAEGVIYGGGMATDNLGDEYSYLVEDTFAPSLSETRTEDSIKVTLFDVTSKKPVWSGIAESTNYNPYYREQDLQLDNIYIKSMKTQNIL